MVIFGMTDMCCRSVP